MDDISNNSAERNFSEEGQDGRDTGMFNSLVSPDKIPSKDNDNSNYLNLNKRVSEVIEIPSEERMDENELFSNLDIPADTNAEKRESFGRLSERENKDDAIITGTAMSK